MDQSYITHQRRPALIPSDVKLDPEDEQAVRIRTGNLMATLSLASAGRSGGGKEMTKLKMGDPTGDKIAQGNNSKRKASTTAEEYYDATNDDMDEDLKGSIEKINISDETEASRDQGRSEAR